MLKVYAWLAVMLYYNCLMSHGKVCQLHTPLQTTFNQNCLRVFNGRQDRNTYCRDAWNDFSRAFSGKEASAVKIEDFNAYFSHVPVEPNVNSVIFWSGTYELVRAVSAKATSTVKYDSSLNIASAIIVNDLGPSDSWCTSGDKNPADVFWAAFSRRLGSVAKGVVYWVTGGEREDCMAPYRTENYFGKYELPAMASPRVTKFVAINVHRKGRGEACGEKSLVELKKEVVYHKNIKDFKCIDVYGMPFTDCNTNREKLAKEVIRIINSQRPGRLQSARGNSTSDESHSSAGISSSSCLLLMATTSVTMMVLVIQSIVF